ncbi:MAG: MFS transporter, partial [Candidatus Heimdallarchaeota archaeon]|nr:MFS transporter [Candidatus Heimdallarchaeota archaeon]
MKKKSWLFVGCIVALSTTSFGFIVRAFLISEWGVRFNLSESQLGSLQGAGLFPFALSIIFFSLVIDRLGYGRTMAIAWVGHITSAIITITASNYTGLYIGTLLFALANGAVEATINPVTATLFPKNKTHYLNILHAGWPGGLVIGGILAIGMSGIEADWAWRLKIGLFLIPAIIYGIMLLTVKFPTQERVAAGVSYRDMLKEFGWAGCLICCFFIAYAFDEILRVFGMGLAGSVKLVIALAPQVWFAGDDRR